MRHGAGEAAGRLAALFGAEVQTRLAEADAMAARGCYLCLREASAAYLNLIGSDNPVDRRHR